jgi:murein DD-endopeptidase MepM/ murein hydrolase activator NlpD
MKKFKIFIKKFLLISFLIMLLIGISSLSTPQINASDIGGLKSYLEYENARLKREYEKLATKLVEMESYLNELYTYDNLIYSQMLGIDFDTTEFYQYYNDTISFILKSNDSIFSNVNKRTLFAAEILATQLIKLQETSDLFKNNKNVINSYPTISPIKTKDFINISSPFGYRVHPIKKKVLYHEGIDISAKFGTPIYSTAQGRVINITYSKYGYGNRVVIEHSYGFETLYAHMDNIKVKKGQWVNKNQLIGTVGNSGLSTGSHLHYEIHKNNQPRDPLGYFYISIGEELIGMN